MDDYKMFAEDLAKKAGDIIKEYFKLGIVKHVKEDTSLVTEADLKINALVLEEIGKRYPKHSVLAEEGSNMLGESEYTWVCDPLDATKAFAHGLPFATFSIALVKDGVPLLGVINDPLSGRLYSAIKGEGAYMNGETIRVSDRTTFDRSLVGCDITQRGKYDALPLLNQLFLMNAAIFRLSACIYTGTLVASGQFVSSLYALNSPHDGAALKVIVEEAGGKVTGMRGEEQRYDEPINGLLVSNGILHDELVELAKKYVIERT